MAPNVRRARLPRVHRWLAVALSPVMALILVSGLVLAARPSLAARRPAVTPHALDLRRLAAVVERVDTAHAGLFFLSADRTQFMLGAIGRPPDGPFDVVTGAPVPMAHDAPPTLFDRAASIHNDLGIRQGWLVALGSVALVLIAGIGPFLSRNAARGTLLGRHVRTGWLLMPLALWLPATLVMMRLDLPHRSPANGAPLPIAAVLRELGAQRDLRDLGVVQTLPGWAFVIARVGTTQQPERYRLQDGTLAPLKGPIARLGYTLHKGEWGGPLGGIVNAVAGLVMLWMLGTGLLSAWRRAVARRAATRRLEQTGMEGLTV
jgi:uncharacterized iron-regulated membrane protein